jgi:hypothetical protein
MGKTTPMCGPEVRKSKQYWRKKNKCGWDETDLKKSQNDTGTKKGWGHGMPFMKSRAIVAWPDFFPLTNHKGKEDCGIQ